MKAQFDIKRISILAALAIPLNQKSDWNEISFDKIRPNQVTYSAAGIQVEVKNSASPLVFKLKESQFVNGFEAQLKFQGDLKLSSSNSEIAEDSIFRLGLVVQGKKVLAGAKKFFAPNWIKQLFALTPENKGLDKIYFFNIGHSRNILGQSRTHPKSDLMFEEIVALKKTNETALKVTKTFDQPLNIAALWLSLDGDDTESEYTTSIEKIILQTHSP